MCRRLHEYLPSNPWRPFCSQRCQLLDLGEWARDHYRISSDEPEDPDNDTHAPHTTR